MLKNNVCAASWYVEWMQSHLRKGFVGSMLAVLFAISMSSAIGCGKSDTSPTVEFAPVTKNGMTLTKVGNLYRATDGAFSIEFPGSQPPDFQELPSEIASSILINSGVKGLTVTISVAAITKEFSATEYDELAAGMALPTFESHKATPATEYGVLAGNRALIARGRGIVANAGSGEDRNKPLEISTWSVPLPAQRKVYFISVMRSPTVAIADVDRIINSVTMAKP